LLWGGAVAAVNFRFGTLGDGALRLESDIGRAGKEEDEKDKVPASTGSMSNGNGNEAELFSCGGDGT